MNYEFWFSKQTQFAAQYFGCNAAKFSCEMHDYPAWKKGRDFSSNLFYLFVHQGIFMTMTSVSWATIKLFMGKFTSEPN